MEIIFRGVRGSITNPSVKVSFYGGSTSCVEVRTEAGDLLYFDAGTGLIAAGDLLPETGECHLFITHAHIDHISGLWYFKPFHQPGWTVHLYFPEWISSILVSFFNDSVFPIPLEQLPGRIVRHPLRANETFAIGDIRVDTCPVEHPGCGLAWRLRADDCTLFYSGDHEITDAPEARAAALEMIRGVDIAIVDATYNRQDYRPGWGHSRWEDWYALAAEAKVKQLALTHHDVKRSDAELDALTRHLGKLQRERGEDGLRVHVAQENMLLTPQGTVPSLRLESSWILDFMDELSRYRDKTTILDRILAKAREITSADAGTIFLVEGKDLVFAYTHNDSLFHADSAWKFMYDATRLPISLESIVGHVAYSGEVLLLHDVQQLPPGAPYRFNASLDQRSGYQTHSMLCVPFFDPDGKVSGVMQLINSINPYTRTPHPFAEHMVNNVRLLAREASNVIAQSLLQRQNIYRILRMVAVHDPCETSAHAERVGAIAAGLYQCWAAHRAYPAETIRHQKDDIRLAAMLHDIGKVGVSHLILQKPGRLDAEETSLMRRHAALGAAILEEAPGEMNRLARDIALHHHQRWDGDGYPEETRLGGEDIPLAARITAIADVFDALVSPRCHREAWSFSAAMDYIRQEAGAHFDPELAGYMDEIGEILPKIYRLFPGAP